MHANTAMNDAKLKVHIICFIIFMTYLFTPVTFSKRIGSRQRIQLELLLFFPSTHIYLKIHNQTHKAAD